MKIWVDADACPVVIREILYKAAERKKVELILVANRRVRFPSSSYIRFLAVPSGQDVADNKIVELLEADDLVITADIPLAARVVEKGAIGINPHGEKYSAENIRERLSTRDFMDSLRTNGVETGGPAPFSKRDRQLFANSLDQLLANVKTNG